MNGQETIDLLRVAIKVLKRQNKTTALYFARHALFTIRLKYSIQARTALFCKFNPQ